MSSQILDERLNFVRNAAEKALRAKYGIKKGLFEQPFEISPSLQWIPTLRWETKTGHIACEVSHRPLSAVIPGAFVELMQSGFPVTLFCAYPQNNSLQTGDLHRDIQKLRGYGIGCISVDDSNNSVIAHKGIPIPLHIPEIDYSLYKPALVPKIKNAYDLYFDDPKHGVQELGQIIEDSFFNLADTALRQNKLTTGYVTGGRHYALGPLIDDFTQSKTLDKVFLGRARAFVPDRNSASHPAKSGKNGKKRTAAAPSWKAHFQEALRILSEFPTACSSKGLKFKI